MQIKKIFISAEEPDFLAVEVTLPNASLQLTKAQLALCQMLDVHDDDLMERIKVFLTSTQTAESFTSSRGQRPADDRSIHYINPSIKSLFELMSKIDIQDPTDASKITMSCLMLKVL